VRVLFHFREACLLYCDVMLKQVLEQGREAADAALEQLLPPAIQHPTSIHQAMRHSVFAGGKRLRPILCMEAGRMIRAALCGDGPEPALSRAEGPRLGGAESRRHTACGIEQVGAALEMLHTYSLIHDDLPALDNDDLRRGRPTCHKAFGEAIAILAGDALQTQAYEVLAQIACPAEARVAIIREVAHATGTIDGMIGGQVVDLEAEHKKPDLATLEYIHRSKTAALITASVVSGGLYAGATDADIVRLRTYGQSIGLAFQIVDDVLDVTQTSEQLGKTAGKDTAAEKTTYPALFGIEESNRKAGALIDQACAELNQYGSAASTLKDLARFLVERKK
jgi:geranylgeranyl diphosphate synthase type II